MITMINNITCTYVGFHEDKNQHTFGIVRKGVYRPLSDFNFYYIMKVESEKFVSTGYLVSVYPEIDETTSREESASRYVSL